MQNDYLNNKKKYNLDNQRNNTPKNFLPKKSIKANNVDVNKLLNRVKSNEIKKKKENFILLGWICIVVGITGIFIIL